MAELSWYVLKKYFRFDREEVRTFLLVSFVFAFILSFDQWGKEIFSFTIGIKNFMTSLVIVASSLYIHDSAHRLMALKMGYVAKLKTWWVGLGVCVLIAILSNGRLALFLGTTVWFTQVVSRRLRKASYVTSPMHFAFMALPGPVASLLFAGIVRALAGWLPFNPATVNQLVYFNLVFGVLSFLPIPPLDGSKFFFYHRLPYSFILGAMIAYAILHIAGYPSILLAVLIGFIIMIYYLYKVEGAIEFG